MKPVALAIVLGLGVPACVGGGEREMPTMAPGEPLMLESEDGLAMVEVEEVDDAGLTQGTHELRVRVSPLDGSGPAELVEVTTFMPAHGHGTSAPEIVELDGEYRVEGLNLPMPGRWELSLVVRVDDALDRAIFSMDVR